MQATLSQDSAATIVFSKGVSDTSSLTPNERLQFTWAMYELFGAFEFMYLASKDDSIPLEVWQRWSSAVAWWLTFPGVRTWWAARPIPFAASFTSYIESLMENNPTDAETTRRYLDFVSQG